MEIRQLEYFQMVCQFNNITRAAQQLHVSQPSISNSMQKLEHELGVTLFNRNKRHLILTREGKVFLKRVDDILERINDAVAEMNDFNRLHKDSLSIGIPPMIGTFLFPHIFIHFQSLHPEIELDISEKGSMAIRRLIERGELDLGIVIISDKSELLDTVPIMETELLVCLNRQHKLCAKHEVAWEDLRNEPIIMLKEGFYNRSKILEQFKALNITPNIVLSSNQLETIKSLVSNGVGIAFLFREIVENDSTIMSKSLITPMQETIGLAWKKNRYLTNASRALVSFIVDSYKN